MFVFGVTEVPTNGTVTVSPVLGTEPFAVRVIGVQVPAGGPQVNVQATEVAVATTLPQAAPPTVTSRTAGMAVPVILSEFPVKVLTVIASTGAV
jgi:hypothetical protein